MVAIPRERTLAIDINPIWAAYALYDNLPEAARALIALDADDNFRTFNFVISMNQTKTLGGDGIARKGVLVVVETDTLVKFRATLVSTGVINDTFNRIMFLPMALTSVQLTYPTYTPPVGQTAPTLAVRGFIV